MPVRAGDVERGHHSVLVVVAAVVLAQVHVGSQHAAEHVDAGSPPPYWAAVSTVVAIPIRGPNNEALAMILVVVVVALEAIYVVATRHEDLRHALVGDLLCIYGDPTGIIPPVLPQRVHHRHYVVEAPALPVHVRPAGEQVLDHVVVAEIHCVEQVGIFRRASSGVAEQFDERQVVRDDRLVDRVGFLVLAALAVGGAAADQLAHDGIVAYAARKNKRRRLAGRHVGAGVDQHADGLSVIVSHRHMQWARLFSHIFVYVGAVLEQRSQSAGPSASGGVPQSGSAVTVGRVVVRAGRNFALDVGCRRVRTSSDEMVERLRRCVQAFLALSRESLLPLPALALDPLFDNFARAPSLLCSY